MNPDHPISREHHAIVPWYPASSPGRVGNPSVLALPDYDLESLVEGVMEESPAHVAAMDPFTSPQRPFPRAIAQSPSAVVCFGITDTPQPAPQAP